MAVFLTRNGHFLFVFELAEIIPPLLRNFTGQVSLQHGCANYDCFNPAK